MKRKKKTEIVVERDQTFVIRRLERGPAFCCAVCGERGRMVSVYEGAVIAQVSERNLYRRVEQGKLHFAETPDGHLLICLRSLLG